MELREALAQITEIRNQIARTETFEGYRSATAALSGSFALLASAAQSVWIPDPLARLDEYLALWVGIAAASASIAGLEMIVRCRRNASETAVRLTHLAVEQFLPALVVGALITAVIASVASESAWMLPGLWSSLFGLGVFASVRVLPRAVSWVALYYIVAGLLCLAVGKGCAPLSPWMMAATFGVGQSIAAAVLYWTLERRHGR